MELEVHVVVSLAWALGTELQSSEGAAGTLNLCVISPGPCTHSITTSSQVFRFSPFLDLGVERKSSMSASLNAPFSYQKQGMYFTLNKHLRKEQID